ncbi:autotransporter-associated beta strand repeat-containing protein [Anatilimnocola sp. NA78]|uniref:autotransporter-associated beta strand repeat-containing protein n=1 Tax=Anatilimnocola sp. NA78 TaxID=3415683 RepID=UPI003CE5223E
MPHSSLHSRGREESRAHLRNKLPAPRRRRLFLEQLEERSLLAVMVWDGSASADWSNAQNWAGNVAPTTGDDLVFPAGAATTTNNNLAPGTRFNTILIQGNGYNITGNAIELYGGLTANNVSGTNTYGLSTTLVNAQTFMSANSLATLNVTGSINTANLLGTTNIFASSALTLDGSGALSISGSIVGSGSLSKLGSGTATLSGANSYEGLTDVRQGVLVANNNSALGSATTGSTLVAAGASLHVAGGRTIAESLSIAESGVGFGSGIDPSTLGALRSVGGNNLWTGAIQLAGTDNVIGVDGGLGSSLNISGKLSAAINTVIDLVKVGGGTLQLSGTADNTFTGATSVLQGTLELNKTAGIDAIGGNLIIGDNIGGDDGAIVRILASNQIPTLTFFDSGLNSVTLNSSGRLEFANAAVSEEIGNLVLTMGSTYSADIDLNGGLLTLGGSTLTLNGFQGSSGVTPAATIQDGTFNVGTFFSGTGGGTTKTFAINDSQLANIATDLHISATIAGASEASITRSGGGTLRLSGNNTFAGPFIWNGGIIEVGSDSVGVVTGPFGTGLFAWQSDGGNTLKAVGGARTIHNAVSIDANNTNFIGSDNLTFTGNVTLTGSRTLRVMDPAQTVTIAGVIGESAFGSQSLNKGGRGTLALTAANTFSGTTTINNDGGTLAVRGAGSILNSSGVTIGVGGVLRIDNSTTNLADRINDAAAVANSGRLHFVGNSSAAASEYLGTISPGQSVQSTIEVENTSAGLFDSLLTFNALTVGTDRPTHFVGTGLPLSAAGRNRLSFTNNPGTLDDGILPQGVVRGPGGAIDFTTFDSSAEGFAIIPLPASAYVTDITQASAFSNVKLSASVALTTSKSINALLIVPDGTGHTLSGTNATVTVNSGAMILGSNSAITTTNLSTGSGFTTVVAGTATITSSIFSNILQKGGRGTLVLGGDNQTSGAINVNEGILEITHSNALGSTAGTTSVRQGATLQLSGDLNIGLEPLSLTGVGFSPNAPGSGADTYGSAIGAINNLSGDSSIAGTITRGGDATDLTGILGGFPVIASANTFVSSQAGTLTLAGTLGSDNVELIKIGGGTLELAGALATGSNTNTRIYQGTLELDREDGVNGISSSTVFIGSDSPTAPSAILRLASNDALADGVSIQVHSSGTFDLNGNSEVIANLNLVVAANDAADVSIGVGGTLTTNGNTTVFTQGTGNAAGATIAGGTLALQIYGTVAAANTRTWQVNDGASGTDLTVSSAIVDGTGLQSLGIIKSGFGSLELGGTGANTLSGTTTVQEGTLLLNKTGGNALAGPLTIGDANPQSGFAGSDAVRYLQPNQLPDYGALVTITPTGLLDLNNHSDTIGVADVQNALSVQAGGAVATGTGTLTLNGNIAGGSDNGDQGAAIFTLTAPFTLSGNLNLGAVPRTIDTNSGSANLPLEVVISAKISGSGGIVKQGNGTLLLSGNNDYSGTTYLGAGDLAVGHDNAFGTSRVYFVSSTLVAYSSARELNNEFVLNGNSTYNLGGSTTLGGGGNNLKFTGPMNIANATVNQNVTFNMPVALQVEFSGGIGESIGSGQGVSKSGFGTVILSGINTYSNSTVVNTNGGTLILRDQGTAFNTNGVTVNVGGVFQIDNLAGANLANRLGDTTGIALSGGTLAFVGKEGTASTEAVGTLTLNANTSSAVHVLTSTAAGSSSNLRLGAITRNANTALAFVARGRDFSSNEIQTLTIPATVTTFNVSFNGSPVSGILTRATLTAAQLQTALEGLPTVGGGNVLVSGATSGPYTITFLNSLSANNVTPLVANLLTGTGAPVVATTAQGTATGASIVVTTAPATTGNNGNEILPYASVRSLSGQIDFATVVGVNSSVQAFTNYATGGINSAVPGSNYLLTASESLTANLSLNSVLIRGNGLTLSGAAATNLTFTSGGLTSVGNGNIISIPTVTLGAEGIVSTTPAQLGGSGATLEIQSAIAETGGARALTSAGIGTLILSGATDNTYTGTVLVTEGVLNARKNKAFGTDAGNVTVTYGGTVELSGGITVGTVGGTSEAIGLSGSGEATLGNVPLRVTGGGIITWLGNITLNNNRTGIDVAAGTELIVGGATNTGVVASNGFNKFGGGTLELTGTGANTLGAASILYQGTLELNKLGGVLALNSGANPAIFVGDHVGSDNSDRLIQLGDNQIADLVGGGNQSIVTVHSSGFYDLGGRTETFGTIANGQDNTNALNLFVGPLFSADVDLNGGTINLVAGNGGAARAHNIFVSVLAGGAPAPVTIEDGNLTFTDGTTGPALSDIVANDSASIEDLIIRANISGSGGFDKTAGGRLVLNPTVGNTYGGTTNIAGGEVVARGTTPLGSTAATGGTSVGSGFSLIIDNVSSAEPLTLNGGGLGGQGAIRSIDGVNTWSGDTVLAGGTSIGVDDSGVGERLILSGAISGAQAMNKLLNGTLQFAGSTSNTFSGTMIVQDGILELNKSGGAIAVQGRIEAGNDSGVGGATADIVRWLQSEQLGVTEQLIANTEGLFELNGNTETVVNNLALAVFTRLGQTSAGRYDLGGGTIILAPTGTAQTVGTNATGLLASSPAGFIGNGNIQFANANAGVFNIADALHLIELEIAATIQNTAASLNKQNAGTLALTGNNSGTYVGATTNLNGGILAIKDGNSLGNATSTVNVTGAASLLAIPGGGSVTDNHNITLGNSLTLRGNEDLTLGGTISGATAQTLAFNLIVGKTATLSGALNLNVAAATALTINNNTFNSDSIVSALINETGVGPMAITKGGVGQVTITGANAHDGVTTVSGGVLRITNAGALGTTTGNTVVAGGASLQVGGGLTISEPLSLASNGFANFGGLWIYDAAAASETITWTGNIALTGNSFVRVDDGGATPDSLNLGGGSAATIVGDFTLSKTGTGILQTSGTGVNTLNTIEVREGIVELNKTGAGTSSDAGTTIGDGGGGDNADILRLLGNEQLSNTQTVTVNASGSLELGAFNETIGALTLNRLMLIAGDVSSTTGTLTLGGTVTVGSGGGLITTGATPASTISGLLNAGGIRTFTINDSYVLNAADDLVIGAVISNATPTKDGTGTLVFTGANTYTGATVVSATTIDFASQGFSNGLTTVVASTLIARGAGTLGTSATADVSVNAGAVLTLDDDTAGTADRIDNTADLTLAGGTLNLVGDAGVGSLEQVNLLSLNAGNSFENRIQLTSDGVSITELRAATLARAAGGTVHFVGVGDHIDDITTNRVQITGTDPLVNNVLPYGTVEGPGSSFDLVTDGDAAIGTPYFVGRVLTYASDINTPNGIVRLDGTEAPANRILSAGNTIAALLLRNGVTVSGANTLQVGTAANPGLIVAQTGNNTISVNQLDYATGGTREPLFLTESGSGLTISSQLSGTGSLRKDRPGALTLSGDNDPTFNGTVTLNSGTLTVAHDDGLGGETASPALVTVNRRATLIFDATSGVRDFQNKPFTFNGYGINDNYTGSLRTIGGNTVTLGNGATVITLGTETPIHTGTGSTLLLNANITGNQTLTKLGAGILEFAGGTTNVSTGARNINEGTLRLNKTGTSLSIQGTTTINDTGNFDPTGAASIIYTGTSTNQIADGVAVNVNSNGTLDTATRSDTIGALTMAGGAVINTGGGGSLGAASLDMRGGSINTGTGTLQLNGNATFTAGLANLGGAAAITGNLHLGNATRTFTIADGVGLNELTIDAAISNGRLVKAGAGGLLLNNGANSFLAGIDETQRIAITAAPTVGSTITLTFNGSTVTALYGATGLATAANIDAALESMANIGPSGVTVTEVGVTNLVFDVQFNNHLGQANLLNLMQFSVTAPGTPTAATNATEQVQGQAGIRLNGGILSIGSNTALGTARVHLDGSSQLLPVGGNKNLTNSLTINPNITITFGGQRAFGGTDDLTLTGGITLIGSTTAQVVNLDVPDNQTLVTMSGVISGGGDLLVPTKRGIGTLAWSGNNTFDVRDYVLTSSLTSNDGIRVEGGILRAANSNALGTSAEIASIMVRGDLGAVLEIDGSGGPVNITGRVLDLSLTDINNLSGLNTRGYLNRTSTADVFTGTLRSLAGVNSIVSPVGQIRLRNVTDGTNSSTIAIGVDAGSLDLDGAIIGLENDTTPTAAANRAVYKVGPGTLRTSGAANTITGGFNVLDGTLELNKTTGPAISGALQIGDNAGLNDSAEVRYVSGALTADQIGNVAVTVNTDGLLNLNNLGSFTDSTSGLITLILGETMSGDIATGSATTHLDPAGGITVTPFTGIVTATPATIAGSLQLAATRTITTNDSPANIELNISAVISQSAAAGVTKAGAGRLALSAANTYAGTTTISGGALQVQHLDALGDTGADTTTIVSPGAVLETAAAGTINNELLRLDSNGTVSGILNGTVPTALVVTALGTGTIRTITGDTTWAGNIDLRSTDGNVRSYALGVESGAILRLSGVISGTNSTPAALNTHNYVKVGEGELELSGASSNLITGGVFVNAGTLTLNKSGTAVAIAGALFVGDSSGGNNADQVLYSPTAGTDNIANTSSVNVLSSGFLNLGALNDQITNLVLVVGPTSGDVLTSTGVLTVAGAVTAIVQRGVTTTPATIGGILALQADAGAAATRTWTVFESSAGDELVVNAVVQNQAAVAGNNMAITKAGRGTLVLAAANTYTGVTTMNTDSGTLLVNGSLANGTAGTDVTINPGSVLGGIGNIDGLVSVAAIGGNLLTGGIVNPGPTGAAPNNTGVLTINNGINFLAGSLLQVDINGITAGTNFDQLVVTGTAAITSAAVPSYANTAMINGTTGNGFFPVNGLDAFKVLSNTAGTITLGPGNGFLSQILPPAPQLSPATVTVGGKTYSTSYNTAVGINDGNDFVLQAVAANRTWDGDANAILSPSNAWSVGLNWVGDVAPFIGDNLVFGDQGNTRESNDNDFVSYSFDTITLNKTVGAAYLLQGNTITLNVASGGINQVATNAASNIVDLDGILLATNPQTITNDSASLLTTNSPIDGTQQLNITGTGDITFAGPVGSNTPLPSIAVATIDDLLFSSTILTTGNVTQTTGTGTTTFSGGNIGGSLTATNEAIVLSGGTTTVVGTASLNATAGSIADGNGAANNITAPALLLSATLGVGPGDAIETTVGNLEAIGGTAGVFVANAGALVIGGVSAANGVSAAGGNITISASGLLTVNEQVNAAAGNVSLTGLGITFNNGGVATSNSLVNLAAGSGPINTTGTNTDVVASTLIATAGAGINLDTDVVDASLATGIGSIIIDEVNALNLVALSNTAGSATITAAGALTNAPGALLTVNGSVSVGGSSIALGSQAGDQLNFASLTFNSPGAVNITEDDSLQLAGSSTAATATLASPVSITNAAAASVIVTGNASFTSPSITLGNQAGDLLNFGSLTFNSSGPVSIAEDDGLQLGGSSMAGSATLSSLVSITNAAAASVVVTGNANFSAPNITLGNQVGDLLNFGSLTFNSAGAVSVAEDDAMLLAGTSTATSVTLNSTVSVTNAAAASVIVSGNASFSAPMITLGNQLGDLLNFGSLTFTSVGAVNVAEDDGLQLAGTSTAASATLSSLVSVTNAAAASVTISGNANFNAPTITLGNQAGDALAFGSLTFNSAGAVSIAEDDAMLLVGTSTAASATLNSLASITNAAAASVAISGNASFSAPTITLGNQAGDLLNFGSLTFNSAGAVNIAEDSATQLAGASTANTLILASPGALTNAAAASVTVIGNATLTAPSIVLGNQAGDAINFGTLTFISTGSVSIEENSNLDLAGASSATGAIVLATIDTNLGTENIAVSNTASVTSGANITLNSGDNTNIAGAVTTPAGSLTVNVDAGSADASGGVATIANTAVITTPLAPVGGAYLNGNDDHDTFNLAPQSTTEFFINGNLPVGTSPGDTLNLDISAAVNPLLTLGGIGAGTWTFGAPLRQVVYTSIEDVNANAAYHLALDANNTPFGNTNVDDHLTLSRSGADFVLSRTGDAIAPDDNDVGIVFQGDFATILSFTYLGSNDRDFLTINDLGGLVNFSGLAPGAGDNTNLAGQAEFFFDGGGNNDTLIFALTGPSASQTYAFGTNSGSTPSNTGEVLSTSNAVDLQTYFANVELVQRTGAGATPGALTVLGSDVADALSIAANGVDSRVSMGVGYTSFDFSGDNFATLNVNALAGADSLNLVSLGSGQTNDPAINLYGQGLFADDGAVDTLRVQSTSGNTGVVTLRSGLGGDLFQLFDAAPTVDFIAGPVVVDGSGGDMTFAVDRLEINDSGDLTGDTVALNALNGTDPDYVLTGLNASGVTFRNIDNLDYTGTSDADNINSQLTPTTTPHDLDAVILRGNGGNDQFRVFTSDQIGGTAPLPSGTPSGVTSVSLFGDADLDTFGETPAGLVGTGAMNVGLVVAPTTQLIRPSMSTAITINGGIPTNPLPAPVGDIIGDTLNLDITSIPNTAPVVVAAGSSGVLNSAGQPVSWSEIEDLNLVDQGKLTNVQIGDLFARTTAANDLIQFSRNNTVAQPHRVRLRINSTFGDYNVSNKTIVYAGDGADYVTQANLTVSAEFYGEGGNDLLYGATNNDWLVGGLDNDSVNGGNGDNVLWGDNAPSSTDVVPPQDSPIGGNDTLSGGTGNDVIYGGGGNDRLGGFDSNDYLHGGFGDDIADGGNGDDRVYGGAGNDQLAGYLGNDLLVGEAGNDILNGGSGNDVLIGGTGEDNMSGEFGNDLLITGSVANEHSTWTSVASVGPFSAATYSNATDNDAALLALLNIWGTSNLRTGLATITHDGVDDDVYGKLGDDDFCWEAADVADQGPTALSPPDFQVPGNGTDERFGPTM